VPNGSVSDKLRVANIMPIRVAVFCHSDAGIVGFNSTWGKSARARVCVCVCVCVCVSNGLYHVSETKVYKIRKEDDARPRSVCSAKETDKKVKLESVRN
jgi:hypothetical protein